jgi:hypothetical protein
MATTLDHLVLGTSDIAKGALWLERFFGVALSPIGQHVRMGTHNRLLSLGPSCYLELIAIDPAGETPFMKRWFGLDTTDVLERIASRPRLLGWVARTTEINALTAKTGCLLGNVHHMARNDFKWRISIPEDGYPIEAGLVPSLIQWDSPVHPCERLPDQGCRFEWMEAAHPNPGKVHYLLGELGLENAMKLTPTPPYSGMTMCAYINTPGGAKTLMS